MAYGSYGIGNMQQPTEEPPQKNTSAELLRKAITDALNKDLNRDHNAAMGGGKWLFGPQLLGD